MQFACALFQLGAMNSSKADLNKSPDKRSNIVLRLLGPGLVTGAAADDPSGIATYSQAGAQFGYGLLWTIFLTTPFMIAREFNFRVHRNLRVSEGVENLLR